MGVMKRCLVPLLTVGMAVVLAPQVRAQAIITNGTGISLGVNQTGELNVSGGSNGSGGVGVEVNGVESTYWGCPCEGWGVGVSGGALNGTSGWADQSTGSSGLTLVSFTNTASTAISIVTIDGGALQITQSYRPSSDPSLYEDDVTITNTTGATIGVGPNAILYRRLMDWDIPSTQFDEYTTVNGNGATNLLHTSDNGFITGNPFDAGAGWGPGGIEGCDPTVTPDVDFYHSGPCDHGALFDFGFPALAAGASQSFEIFYGGYGSLGDGAGSNDEAKALLALGNVGASNVYSLAQSSACTNAGDPASCIADEQTFIFGFKGVGGTTLPGSAPEPATLVLFGSGLLGLGGFVRLRRKG